MKQKNRLTSLSIYLYISVDLTQSLVCDRSDSCFKEGIWPLVSREVIKYHLTNNYEIYIMTNYYEIIYKTFD